METELYIAEDGQISCIYQDEISDALKEIGHLTNKRACFVEPFWLETSKWSVDVTPVLNMYPPLSGNYCCGGLIGVFNTREEALKIEAEWLRHYLSTFHFCTWNSDTRQFD